MNSITSNESDNSDDDDLFVIVTEIQNTQQVKEVWDRTWAEPEDDFKVAFLYHYFSLHLKDDLFYFIDVFSKSYPMTWNSPIFKDTSIQLKIFDPQEAYLLSIKEIKSEVYKCLTMIFGGALSDSSGTVYYKSFPSLQFNYYQNRLIRIAWNRCFCQSKLLNCLIRQNISKTSNTRGYIQIHQQHK